MEITNKTGSTKVENYTKISVDREDTFRLQLPDGPYNDVPGVQVKSHGIGGGIVRLDRSGVDFARANERRDAVILECGDDTSVYLSVEQVKALAAEVERLGL
jgi:hypothetical protein